jgi:hypothetical protein
VFFVRSVPPCEVFLDWFFLNLLTLVCQLVEEFKEEVARNALAQGVSPELVHTITGLDIEAINSMQLSL